MACMHALCEIDFHRPSRFAKDDESSSGKEMYFRLDAWKGELPKITETLNGITALSLRRQHLPPRHHRLLVHHRRVAGGFCRS